MQFTWKTTLQRFNGGAVAALLTANAFAVVLVLGNDAPAPEGVVPPAGEGAPEASQETITLVTGADGQQFVADPSTPEGRAAIERARDAGARVTTVTTTESTSPSSTSFSSTPFSSTPFSSTSPSTMPLGPVGANGGSTLLPGLDLSTLPKLPVDLGGTIGGVQRTVDGVVDEVQGTVDRVIDGVQGTVPAPVDPIVDGAQGTLGGVVDGVQGTVGGVTGGVTGTAPTGPAPTGDVVEGLLGVVGETVPAPLAPVGSTSPTAPTGGGLLGL